MEFFFVIWILAGSAVFLLYLGMVLAEEEELKLTSRMVKTNIDGTDSKLREGYISGSNFFYLETDTTELCVVKLKDTIEVQK